MRGCHWVQIGPNASTTDSGTMSTTPETQQPAHLRQLQAAAPIKLHAKGEHLLALAEVERRTRMRKSAIYAGMAAGTFPRNVKLPGGRAVAWPASRIDAWIASVIDASDLASQGGAK